MEKAGKQLKLPLLTAAEDSWGEKRQNQGPFYIGLLCCMFFKTRQVQIGTIGTWKQPVGSSMPTPPHPGATGCFQQKLHWIWQQLSFLWLGQAKRGHRKHGINDLLLMQSPVTWRQRREVTLLLFSAFLCSIIRNIQRCLPRKMQIKSGLAELSKKFVFKMVPWQTHTYSNQISQLWHFRAAGKSPMKEDMLEFHKGEKNPSKSAIYLTLSQWHSRKRFHALNTDRWVSLRRWKDHAGK